MEAAFLFIIFIFKFVPGFGKLMVLEGFFQSADLLQPNDFIQFHAQIFFLF